MYVIFQGFVIKNYKFTNKVISEFFLTLNSKIYDTEMFITMEIIFVVLWVQTYE